MTRQVMGGRQIIPRIRGYVGEVISELKKVVWPTRDETRRLTVLVIIIAGSIGVFLAVWDYGFSQFMRWIVNLG